ncbi:MAG: DUF3619 family protein [Ramlibacter sp.]|nr:DUF3619 family protein [Ramlibacter sp.]
MTNTPLTHSQQLQERFGRQVAARLAAGAAELPYEVTERLRAARVQAVARRKPVSMQFAPVLATAGGLRFGDERLGFWSRIGSALPLVALVAGLVVIHTIENDRRASEVAEVDAALLTDDLPPAAYADPGFVQFLKTNRD